MKVLGRSGDRPSKVLCDELRPLADGLDLFTGGTRPDGRIDGDGIDIDDDVASDWTTDDDG